MPGRGDGNHLGGTADRDSVFGDPEDWDAQNDVELLLETTVLSIDTSARVVHTDHGDAVPYSGLLLATGAAARRLWVRDGRVVAGMNVNVWDVNEAVQGMIRRGNPVDLDRLTDGTVPLESL